MTARSPQRDGAGFFVAPEQVNQRRYEALRGFFVDGRTHAQAGQRFGYTRWAMVNLVREHRAGKLELFAPPRKPGPPPGTAPAKDRARGRVIELRRDGLSTYPGTSTRPRGPAPYPRYRSPRAAITAGGTAREWETPDVDDETAPPAVDHTIGRRLGEVRAWRGLSLRTAAELAGFSASYLSMIERGLRPVDKRSTLEAMANALRVAPSELTGTPYPPTDAASSEAHAAISALRRALVETELGDYIETDRLLRPQSMLRAELAEVSVLHQNCDYAGLGRVLPAVLRDLHVTLHASGN